MKKKELNWQLFLQIIKFGFSGVVCTIIDFALLYICTERIGINYLLSSTISYIVSFVTNYILSITVVFEIDKNKGKIKNFAIFSILSAIALLLNELIMWFGVDICELYYMLVKAGTTVFIMVFNFITRKIFLEKH